MSDKREDILVRLMAIYRTVDGVAKVVRNEQVADDGNFPTLLLLDADEEAEDTTGRGRPPTGLVRVTMTPETYLILGDLPENVASELNRYRARIVKAVLSDAELLTIVGKNGEIAYLGCATSLTRGREIIGDIGLNFAITYKLNQADL